jgi:serine protease Do
MKRFSFFSLFFLAVLCSASLPAASDSLPDFVSLAKKHSPSVVKIETETRAKVTSQHRGYGIPEDEVPEIFRHFFGDPRLFQYPDSVPRQQRPRQAMGSGFIISSDGYVLTNNHVVDGADTIVVNLNDGNEKEAELVGTDPLSDLALLKIDADDLPTVTFSKTPAKVGEWVLAIGSPFGLDYSVSQGIVSAIGRSLPSHDNSNYVPFIQTDVAINPGNSGGPLFNLQGEVVGINSQIFTRSGGYMGLSFAIPADLAQRVVEQLRDKGYVSRGWLGVSIQDVDMDLAQSFGLKKPRGALVVQLVDDSPSEGALKEGDIILEFNGTEIRKSGDLPHVVGMTPAGTKVHMKVMRQGKEKNVAMTLGELSDDEADNVFSTKPAAPDSDNPLGVIVGPLSDRARQELAITGGVVVRQVLPGSPAEATGLRAGDIITQLGFASIEDEADFEQQSKKLTRGTPQPIRFFRRGQPAFRTILIE